MKNWPLISLADAYWFQEGPGVRKWQFRSSGVKLLNVGNITKEGTLDLSKSDRHLGAEEVAEKYSHFLIDDGDLVIASSGISFDEDGLLRTRGVFVEAHHLPLCLNTSTIRFKSKKGVSSLALLRYWLDSPEFRSQITRLVTGSAQQNFGPSHLKATKITMPPLAEQERIVKLLDEADELRKLRAQADRSADALISALFQETFGGGKFKSVSVGELTSLVTSGSTPRGGDEVYTTEGPYFIRSQNVRMNRLDLTDAACLPADVHAQMTRTKVSTGDVLLNITGASIGRVTWVDKLDREANVSQHVCLIRPKSDLLNSTYLSVFISLPATQRFILQIQSGASRQALNHKQVRTLEIPLPPIPLQKEFAKRVTEIRELVASQATSRTRLDALFQSMLHRAFNGEL
jgi:type I restriction enzyme S subunit